MAVRTVTAEAAAMNIIALMTAKAGRGCGHCGCCWLHVADLAFQADVCTRQREVGSLMIELPARPRKGVMTILAIRP